MILKTFGVDPASSPFNEWLKNNALYVALGVAGVVLIIVLVLFFISKRKKD